MSGRTLRVGVVAVVVDGHEVPGGDGPGHDSVGRHLDVQAGELVVRRVELLRRARCGDRRAHGHGVRPGSNLRIRNRLAADHLPRLDRVGGDPGDEAAPPHRVCFSSEIDSKTVLDDTTSPKPEVPHDLELGVGGQGADVAGPVEDRRGTVLLGLHRGTAPLGDPGDHRCGHGPGLQHQGRRDDPAEAGAGRRRRVDVDGIGILERRRPVPDHRQVDRIRCLGTVRGTHRTADQ